VRVAGSIILQQPLDVIELDLRAGRVGEAAAQFFEDATDPLYVDLAGDFHRVIVVELIVAKRPSNRIVAVGASLLPALGIAGAIARLVARPSPSAAPVTIATLPAKPSIMFSLD